MAPQPPMVHFGFKVVYEDIEIQCNHHVWNHLARQVGLCGRKSLPETLWSWAHLSSLDSNKCCSGGFDPSSTTITSWICLGFGVNGMELRDGVLNALNPKS